MHSNVYLHAHAQACAHAGPFERAYSGADKCGGPKALIMEPERSLSLSLGKHFLISIRSQLALLFSV